MIAAHPTPRLDDGPDPLERYGIVRHSADQFVVGGFRYSRLEDAVAEAKRRLQPAGDGM